MIVMAVVGYLRVWDAGFIWDDDAYVTANMTLRDFSGLIDIWAKPGATPQYYPMVHSTFWLEYQVWGENPRGFHVVNVLLHIATSLLLARLLQKLDLSLAWPAAFLFALHPIQVESVAWITERKNVLSGFFYLLSALSLLEWRFPASEPKEQSSTFGVSCRPLYYWLAFVLFVFALLSKTTTCVLPAAFAVLIWWKNGRISARDWSSLSPFFLLGVSFGLLTAWMEKWRVGAVGEEFSLTVLEKFLVATHALCFYVGKAILPWNLTFIYPRWNFNVFHISLIIAPLLCLVAAVIVVYQASQGRRGPFAIAALYAGSLFPALGFFNVYPMRYSFVADHFSYLSMMPLLAGVAWVVFDFAPNTWRASLRSSSSALSQSSLPPSRTVGPLQISCVLIAAVCIPLTFMQTGIYSDLETLWRTTLERNPTAWMAHHNLGKLLEEKKQPTEALEHYESAYALNAKHFMAMNNAGLLQIAAGRFEDAEVALRNAVAVKPDFDKAHNNLAIALVRQGRLREAVEEFDKALTISPDYQNAKLNRAAVISTMASPQR